MIRTNIFPGRYVQGDGAIEGLGVEMSRFGRKGFVICGPFVSANLLPNFRESLEGAIQTRIVEFGGECSDEEIARLSEISKKSASDVIVGIGGGKTLDTAKAGIELEPGIELCRIQIESWRVVYLVEEKWEFVSVLAIRKRPPYQYNDLEKLIEG